MLRLERKYLVPNYLMDELRDRLKPFVRKDRYAISVNGKNPEYVVRSIYFDSRNLDCYVEKKEGILLRKKFRIRAYGNKGENKKIAFEIKRKIANRIKKHRSFVHLEDVSNILNTGNVELYVMQDNGYNGALDDARRFFYHIKKNHFLPTCLVVYEREAYHGKFDKGVRVTLDKNIRSISYPDIDDLYHDGNLNFLFKNHFILEIKYFTHFMPVWARSLIQEFKLRNEALSKYVIGYDASNENAYRAKTIVKY